MPTIKWLTEWLCERYKIRKITGNYNKNISILNNNNNIISNIKDIADTLGTCFANISSNSGYSEPFKSYKWNEEKKKLNIPNRNED